MTIDSQPSEVTYSGDGVTVSFQIPFPFDTSADLRVFSTDTVSGVVTPMPTGWSVIGTAIVFATAPVATVEITILDDPAQTQPTDYVSNDAFPAESHEKALDRVTRLCKRLHQQYLRTLRFPDGDVVTDGALASPVSRKGKYLFFNLVTGAIEYASAVIGTTLSQSILANFLYPQTAAEVAAGVIPQPYPYGDVRRYGVVANSPGTASANTAALAAAWNPAHGITGDFDFPNTTGADTYYFSNVIPVVRGVKIRGNRCTLNFTYTTTSVHANSGCLFSLGDFSAEDLTINVTVDTSGGSSSGNAFMFGARGDDSAFYPGTYDSLLATPMGNITVRNVRVIQNLTGSNTASGGGIAMIGGLRNVVLDNVDISGNAAQPVTYEFGWATSGTTSSRQTSHMHNFHARNLHITNSGTTAIGVTLTGAYSATVENLYMNGGAGAIVVSSGESLFYRPWTSVDDIGAKRNIALRNINVQGGTGTAITLTGAQSASGGYLATVIAALGHPNDYLAETDLLDVTLNGFVLDGTSGGWGILTSAGKADIRNGRITGFQRGIVRTDECTRLLVNNVEVRGCTQQGIQLDVGSAIFGTPRLLEGEIRHCYIGGNSTSSAGTYAAIEVGANVETLIIEGNRIGYETGYRGVAETTQGDGVYIASASAAGVVCRNNHGGGCAGSGVMYHNVNNTPPGNSHRIQDATGVKTSSGLWLTDIESATAPAITNNATIATNGLRVSRVNPGGAVTGIILESGGNPNQEIIVVNEAGSANSVTFATAGTSHVVDGTSSVIAGARAARFVWDSQTSFWYRQ